MEALDAGLSAPEIARRAGVSVSAVCRALGREGLHTPRQASRRRARERYALLLQLAERSDAADAATVALLRRRVEPHGPR
jgi:AraC-like DNA-binding protein